jgi:hypothetical protein
VRPIEICRFMRLLFEDEAVADQAAEIGQAILAARSLRMEKMLVLLLLVYAVAFLIGERLRDVLYSEPVGENEGVPEDEGIPGCPQRKAGENGNGTPACSSCSNKKGGFRPPIGLLWWRTPGEPLPLLSSLSQLVPEPQGIQLRVEPGMVKSI